MGAYLLLFAAGLLAGTMNAAAGGGSFVTLPAMIAAGVPSVQANASSTVALFPGAVASMIELRHELRPFPGISFKTLIPISFAGGLVGALLLLYTPSRTFDALIPFLLAFGTVAFAFGRQAGAIVRRHLSIGPRTLMMCQFVLSIYGGYFGGAVGIMTMAMWSLLGFSDIKAMNAAKVLLVGTMNSIALVTFIIAGQVYWPETITMLVAAAIGGYGGAHVARRLSPNAIRTGITCLNVLITTVFFVKTFWH